MSLESAAGDTRNVPIRLDGQVAIITGAGGGLGRAYALALAARGASLFVNDLGGTRDGMGSSTAAADAVVEEIRAAGGQAVANYDSVAFAEGGERIVASALEAFGRVDILVNNAGNLRDKSFAKLTAEMWEAVLAVHLNGAFNVTQPAFRLMREQNYGRIVFATSAAGLFGNFGQTNYGAAKLGVIGLMNCLKPEAANYGIMVNAVAPMAVTRLNREIIPEDLHEKLKPECVAPLVVYLCSKECEVSGHIFNAGMGYFSRTAFVTGLGVRLGDDGRIPTPEDVRAHWADIDALSDLVLEDAPSALLTMAALE